MKFVKTIGGRYINLLHIRKFFLSYIDKNECKVEAQISDTLNGNCECYVLKRFKVDPNSATQFDAKAEAQAWLDKFIAELELKTEK